MENYTIVKVYHKGQDKTIKLINKEFKEATEIWIKIVKKQLQRKSKNLRLIAMYSEACYALHVFTNNN